MSAIKINNLVKRWGGFTAVDDISFEMGEAEFVALLGPSGCASASCHMTRLQDKHAATLQTKSLHLDVLRDLKQINSHLVSVAHPILEEAGLLRDSRLRKA